jgi:predicted transcriptional regulator
MKKKVIILLSSIFLCLIISAVKVNASTPISPISEVYKEGIYQLNKEDTGSYNLQYQFLNKDKDSAIIILDENDDIVYKNINCNRKCNAGVITNKNKIIIISDGEVMLDFTKAK